MSRSTSSGQLDGRIGGFVLLHRGTMSKAGAVASIASRADSGSGELTGIAGTLQIEIKRRPSTCYDLA